MKKRLTKKAINIISFFQPFFFYVAFFCFLFSCKENLDPVFNHVTDQKLQLTIQKSRACIDSAQHILHDGDIVLRTGNDFTSQALKQFNRQDDTYSHCGIVWKENDSFFVYHAIGGETNPKQKLQREWFPYFCDGAANAGFGIFRFSLDSSSLQRAKKFVIEKFNNGALFDLQFDLKTDDSLYCSEFVVKAMQYALQNPHLMDTTFAGGKAYFSVDNIFLNKKGEMIHQYTF